MLGSTSADAATVPPAAGEAALAPTEDVAKIAKATSQPVVMVLEDAEATLKCMLTPLPLVLGDIPRSVSILNERYLGNVKQSGYDLVNAPWGVPIRNSANNP